MAKGRLIQITDNMSTVERVVLCAAELCGTAILVFLGCGGCIAWGGQAPTHLQVCFTFGLAVMLAVQVFGHISGAHINPVVTVAAVTLGNISLIQALVYFVGQTLGAFGGIGLLKWVTPSDLTTGKNGTLGLCSPGLSAGVSPMEGLVVEFLLSFMLGWACCGVWDIRNKTHHDSVSIRLGFSITVLALMGGPYTGANMNPVRSFAPALVNGDWANHWIYWIGPLAGGVLSALLYRLLFTKESEPEANNVAEVIPLNAKP